jgi:hypothetical protein
MSNSEIAPSTWPTSLAVSKLVAGVAFKSSQLRNNRLVRDLSLQSPSPRCDLEKYRES